MILVIGACASGKTEYVKSLGYAEADFTASLEVPGRVLTHLQDVVSAAPHKAMELLEPLCAYEVIICNEVGSGVIPVSAQERASREQTGRLCNALAQRAERVVRLVCGIPQVIKDKPKLTVRILRHGKTQGNGARCYNGTIDDPLSPEGIAQAEAKVPDLAVKRVFVSPLSRARQTAAILFPNAEQTVIPNLREMCFGVFEGRTFDEVGALPEYQNWLNSNGVLAPQGGENRAAFCARVSAGFREAVEIARREHLPEVVIVAHGGTIMGIMSSMCRSPALAYFDWDSTNLTGWRGEVTDDGYIVNAVRC